LALRDEENKKFVVPDPEKVEGPTKDKWWEMKTKDFRFELRKNKVLNN